MAIEHIDLAVGKYVLTEDVQNPKPDRRAKYDWRLEPVWPKGTIFVVREHSDTFDHGQEAGTVYRWKTIHRAGKWTHQELPLRKHREPDDFECIKAEKLVEKLQFVPTKSLGDLLAGPGNHNAPELIAICLDRGFLTIEEVEKAVTIFNEMDEDQYHKLRKDNELNNA